jgi:hypothetical protein
MIMSVRIWGRNSLDHMVLMIMRVRIWESNSPDHMDMGEKSFGLIV